MHDTVYTAHDIIYKLHDIIYTGHDIIHIVHNIIYSECYSLQNTILFKIRNIVRIKHSHLHDMVKYISVMISVGYMYVSTLYVSL